MTWDGAAAGSLAAPNCVGCAQGGSGDRACMGLEQACSSGPGLAAGDCEERLARGCAWAGLVACSASMCRGWALSGPGDLAGEGDVDAGNGDWAGTQTC